MLSNWPLAPAACPDGADWTAPGSCICVVNSHFPDLISSAACAATDTAVARDRASKVPPAALVIASGLLNLHEANKDGCACITCARKIGASEKFSARSGKGCPGW